MRALTDGKTSIGAQLFHDRKKPAICVQKGNKLKIYGYFQNVETALEFMHEIGQNIAVLSWRLFGRT